MKDALKDARMPTCCRIPYRKTSYITEPFRPVILNYKDEFGMPYWDHWQKVDEILLEELIALSVYLDPLRFPGSEPQRKAHLDIYIKAVGATNVDESGNDYYDNNEINRNPTNDRLEAANDAIDEGSLRPDRVVVNETGRIYYINRVKFVNWALSLGWELPPEMAAWATLAIPPIPETTVQPAATPPPESATLFEEEPLKGTEPPKRRKQISPRDDALENFLSHLVKEGNLSPEQLPFTGQALIAAYNKHTTSPKLKITVKDKVGFLNRQKPHLCNKLDVSNVNFSRNSQDSGAGIITNILKEKPFKAAR
ncbi:MAG: hypothetical protein HQL56_16385 [Magnetococcales bacterium]|nr:hypothetical protein [Magnetococcales bacterium]